MSVFKSTLKMAFATFCSRILGLVREQVMAAYFGASGVTDAFLVAYRIPNLLRDLFAEGAFSSAFVPTFVEANQESKEEARKLLWSLFWLLSLITGTICLGIIFFAPELIRVFAPSFIGQPEKFEMTVNLTRIMAPFLTFVSLAALFMGALNSLKVFFIPSLAPAFYNVMSILSMVGLSSLLQYTGHHPIYSLGIGAMLGGFMQAFVQVPLLLQKGFYPLWPKQFWTSRAKKIVTLIGPGLLGFAAAQINLLITTILATGAMVGATSWLNYSFRLFQLPVGILSVSIGNSNLVHFSEAWKAKKIEEAKRSLQVSFDLSFVTIMPTLVMLYFFSDEIVHLIFERGKFTRFSTEMTAEALRMYALGLPFYGLYKIWVPTFYALDRQKIPVIGSLISIAVNILFCTLMTPVLGFKALALGTTLSVLINALFQSIVLKRDLSLDYRFFFSPRLMKILASTFFVSLVSIFILKISVFDLGFIQKAVVLSVQLFSVGLLYFIFLYWMGERELVGAIREKWRKKLKKK